MTNETAIPAMPVQRDFRRITRLGGIALALLGLVWPLITGGGFLLTIGTLVAMNLIGAVSLHLIIRTGHVSLAHAAFMGLGAYTAALTLLRLGWVFPFNLLAGATVPAIFALALGPILLRLTGKYFVLVTFMLGEIVRLVLTQWTSVTGGANGIFGIPAPLPAFDGPVAFYYLVLFVSLLSIGLVLRILVSPIGEIIDAVREAERVAACSGVHVLRIKVLAFVIACALVGLQGGLYAHYVRYVDPGGFTSVQSLNFVVMNVIGGMGHFIGPVIGTVFLVATPEFLRDYVEVQQILFGALMIIVMAALPGGLASLAERGRLRFGRAA